MLRKKITALISEKDKSTAIDWVPKKELDMSASDAERRISAETIEKLEKLDVTDWDETVLYESENGDKTDPVKVKDLTPKQFFDIVKTQKHQIGDDVLSAAYDTALTMLNKFRVTRQIDAAKKTVFYLETITKERELIKLGIDQFIYLPNILDYIKNVENKSVCITEIDRYERNIPDEIVDKMLQLEGIFDQYYVLFVDYTGKQRSKTEKERRSADPILFGVFQNEKATYLCDRWYYVGDWIDEHCDLTLAQMLTDIAHIDSIDESNFLHRIRTPEDIESFKSELARYEKDADGHYRYKDKE